MNNHDNTQQLLVDYCIDKFLVLPKRPLLVAITGESGSGKSHFTKAICKTLDDREIPYSFVNHDDFLIPRHEREQLREKRYTTGEFNGKSYWEVLENWYFLEEFQTLITKLKHNEPASYHPYVHATGETGNEVKTISPNQIIILENKLFLDQMDFVIELVVERESIIERKITRDSDVRTPEQTKEMHMKAQGYFWDRCKPKQADIRIDNNDFTNPTLLTG